MKKFTKISALLIFTLGFGLQTLQAGLDPLKEVFAGKPWQFVEEELVCKPDKQVDAFLERLKRWSAAAAAGTAGGFGAY